MSREPELSSDVLQQVPLLVTKLHVPPTRAKLVSRPRLVERLREGMNCKLTVVSAPAGFGKTTLLSEWATQSKSPVAWVSLDEGDNDPARFWAYFLAAMRTIQAGIEESARHLLDSPHPPCTETVLTVLINQTATVPDDFALILDDYHVINAQPIHSTINFLIDHSPPQMHLVIASRATPPLPVARLRARNQLVELHGKHLQFNCDESASFLNDIMGLNLSTEDVAALNTCTEGWASGLQLVGLCMQRQENDEGEFIKTFTGDHRYLLDYLSQEVLDRQPESTQAFLLQTCILDQLCDSLCDAITGQGNGQEMLKRLEKKNLFILPLDIERHWYRYHHLFSDFLRRHLAQLHPDQTLALHRRASEWYTQNGLITQAVDHALAAKDFQRAACLVEENGLRFLFQAQIATVMGWLGTLPDEIVRSRPRICIYYAWALSISSFQYDAAKAWLQDAGRALGIGAGGAADSSAEKTAEEPTLSEYRFSESKFVREMGEMAAISAHIAEMQGDMDQAIALAHQALEDLPEDHVTTRSIATWALGLAYRYSGDTEAASRTFTEALTLSRVAGIPCITLAIFHNLAKVQMAQGQLHLAYATGHQGLQLAAEQNIQGIPAVGHICVGMAGLLYEWNDLQAAECQVMKGISVAKLGGAPAIVQHGSATLAYVKQAQGDLDGALETLQDARSLVPREPATWYNAELATCQARLWLIQGNLQAAAHWAQGRGLSVDDEVPYNYEPEYLTLARLLIAQARRDENPQDLRDALKLLDRLLRAAQTSGRRGSVIEIRLLQALALHAQGQIAKAMIALERAFSLAQPEGYVRVFVDEGAPIAELLHQAASRGLMPDYVCTLLAAFGDGIPSTARHKPRAPETQPCVEPLSEREIEVLRLLAARLSSQEIANELAISVHTARTHAKNIYGKLGVHNRNQAAERARALSLLSP
jgi:LuxR family maltose regulon positive regulatory protein